MSETQMFEPPTAANPTAREKERTEALLRSYYAAFNRADTAGMLACVSDSVVHDVNQGPRRTGRAAFEQFCAHMSLCYAEKLTDIVVLANADGSRAAAEFNVQGRYLATDEGMPDAQGQTYVLPAGTFFAIDNGLIQRVTTYYNLTDWLVQVVGDPPS